MPPVWAIARDPCRSGTDLHTPGTIPGLDIERLKADVSSPEVARRINNDVKPFANTSTPQFIFNERFFEGSTTEAQLDLFIDEASAQQQ